MKPLIYSEVSLQDCESILETISRDKPQAAILFVEQVLRQCEILAQAPELGEARKHLHPDLRLFCFRNYGIYYRNLSNQVRIERVWHGALNVTAKNFDLD